VLSIASDAAFTIPVPGFKQKEVLGTSATVENTVTSAVPSFSSTAYRSDRSIGAAWSYPTTPLGYRVDVSTDPNFGYTLYHYTKTWTPLNYLTIGTALLSPFTIPVPSPVSSPTNPILDASGSLITGLLGNQTYPRLDYVLQESSIRLQKDNQYSTIAIAEEVDVRRWLHVAIVNDQKYTYLYVDGERCDRIRNIEFNPAFDIGYSIGHFNGSITGVRITKGVARYTTPMIAIPTLPYSKN
jgi:hypothetical protein